MKNFVEIRQVFEKDPDEWTEDDFQKIVEVLRQRLEKIRQARQDSALINQKIDKISGKRRKKNANPDQ